MAFPFLASSRAVSPRPSAPPQRVRWFTLPGLLAAAVFATVVAIPFLPVAKSTPRFFLEIALAASVAGEAKVYYDIGAGYRENDSSAQRVTNATTPRVARFPLPTGEFRSLRIDPLDRPGTIVIHGPPRIVAQESAEVHRLNLSDIVALQEIASIRAEGETRVIVTADAAADPQLVVRFARPLRIATGVTLLARQWIALAFPVFAAGALFLFTIDRATRTRDALVRAVRTLARRRKIAVGLVAAVAVAASAYPVVFLGKSHVSPNFGATLLYEAFPSLPGSGSSETASVNGSDVGAAMWQHVPYAFVQRRALGEGELPLWNRHTLTGAPLLAQAQSMFGDPLHLFVVLFDGAAWAWDLKYLAAKWLFAAGVGLLVLALARHVPSACLVAAAAPFVGFYVFRINHPAIFTVGYAPWVLLAWVGLAQTGSRQGLLRWTAALGVADFVLVNSGTAKEAWVLVVQMNLAGALLVLAAATSWPARLLRLVAGGWAGLLALLMAAPMWATFLQTLAHAYTISTRAAADQIQPSLLLGAFDELFFRPLSQGDIVFNPSLNFLLLLGVLYFVATALTHARDRPAIALTLVTLASMAVVFGVVPPAWIKPLPLFGNIGHIENCLLCGLLVLWSILAGFGFKAAAARLGTAGGRGDLAVTATLLFAMVAAWIGFLHASHRSVYGPGVTFSVHRSGEVLAVSPFIWGSLAVLLTASLGFGWVVRHGLARRTAGPGVIILGVLCAGILLWRNGLHAASLGFEAYLVRPPPRADFHAPSRAIDFVRNQHQREPARVFGVHGNLTPGWNAAYGLEAIHGPDALQNGRLRELVDASPLKWGSSWRLYSTSRDIPAVRPFLDALNVRFLLDLPGNPPIVDPAVRLVERADLDVYESSTAWPRAFFTDRLVAYTSPADLMPKILASAGRPFAAMQADELAGNAALAGLSSDVETRTSAPATNYLLRQNSTAFDVDAAGPGVVVLTEAWWRDSFRARVDGQPAPILRVNHAFKGVFIGGAGRHRVEFYYWPRRFTRYLTFAAVGAGLFVLTLALGFVPERSKPRSVA